MAMMESPGHPGRGSSVTWGAGEEGLHVGSIQKKEHTHITEGGAPGSFHSSVAAMETRWGSS